ncbi:putative carbonic anhydrase 2 [Helianthus annuus]|uniref:putative carbonic anhydrase 2 n=1 Tax=Helianthus annuus TaxID=4232 RepID=UPI000B90216D|nr:putative carbonic anhydrase 2 [Helianthus annuus]
MKNLRPDLALPRCRRRILSNRFHSMKNQSIQKEFSLEVADAEALSLVEVEQHSSSPSQSPVNIYFHLHRLWVQKHCRWWTFWGYYDDRVDDDEDWGYINRGNGYNARGYEDEEFGYQNANYVGDDDYGHGNRRNDGYENNRQPRNNNQRNRNDGYYSNNNNGNPNRIPRFVGGGNQRGNQGRNHGRDERWDERRNEMRDDRRDNRRMGDQEFNGPYHHQQPPRGVNDRFRPIVTENDSPIVCERRIFDCKPHYINILPHFNGRSNDEPYTHLAEFSSVCNTIGGTTLH